MAFKMKGSPHKTGTVQGTASALKQTDSDLKEYLLSEKGFNQEDADLQVKDGSYDVNNAGFKKWFETSSKSDNQKKDVDGDLANERINQPVAKEEDAKTE